MFLITYWWNWKVEELKVERRDDYYIYFDKYVYLEKRMLKQLINVPQYLSDDGGYYYIVTTDAELGKIILYEMMIEDTKERHNRLGNAIKILENELRSIMRGE